MLMVPKDTASTVNNVNLISVAAKDPDSSSNVEFVGDFECTTVLNRGNCQGVRVDQYEEVYT